MKTIRQIESKNGDYVAVHSTTGKVEVTIEVGGSNVVMERDHLIEFRKAIEGALSDVPTPVSNTPTSRASGYQRVQIKNGE